MTAASAREHERHRIIVIYTVQILQDLKRRVFFIN